MLDDPNEIRTRVTAVKGRCLNRLTMGPYSGLHGAPPNSPSRTRTYDPTVNSRLLYRLSYRGISIALTGIVYYTFLNFASTIFIFFDTYLQNHILNCWSSEYFTTLFSLNLIGQALDRLVSVSSMCYHTSTSDLSTSSSSRGLTTCVWDISSWGGLHA